MKNFDTTPIFIHSLFRSGSSYIFKVFRRSDSGYWCYHEPLHEYLLYAAAEPDRFLEIGRESQRHFRHPDIEKPYFYEFHAIADEVGRYFRKEFSFEQYFAAEKDGFTEIKSYFSALANGSKGRPVFQCCRTTGRVEGLKSECGGVHIFLWRNPWDQWWSYKKDVYFDRCNLFISDAKNLPAFLKVLKKELKLPYSHDMDTITYYRFFNRYRLNAIASYKLFYALWCHTILETIPHCELSVDIDKLSTSISYRKETLEKLEQTGIGGLDLSDCSVPMASYGESDSDFFLEIEDYVHELLLSHGYSHAQVDELKLLSKERKESLVDVSVPKNFSVRDAMRAREYQERTEMELAEAQRVIFEAEASVGEAEARIGEAEARAGEAEANAEQLYTMLNSVFKSYSWRITAPLRWIKHQTNLLLQQGLIARTRALVKKITKPSIRRNISIVDDKVDDKVDDLSPHVRKIYAEIKHAIKDCQEKDD